MRLPAAAMLFLSVCAAPLYGQASRGAPLSPIQLEDQWTNALVKRDARTFDRLLAPGFVYTEDASVMNRSEVIKSVPVLIVSSGPAMKA
jgi:hypothetical protein